MKNLRFAFIAAAGWLAITPTAQADQKLVPAQSEISFVSQQMGVPVEGRFRKFDAQVAFNPQKLDAAKITFKIDLGSATLGLPETDAELAKPEWFHIKLFPQATFQSSSVKALGGNQFEVRGKLSIKSISQEVSIPVLLKPGAGASSGTAVATGAFAIKRLDFQIGNGDWKDTSVVADAVQVKFKLTLSGMNSL
jgi:polyisoprenoid-binding protein YceI